MGEMISKKACDSIASKIKTLSKKVNRLLRNIGDAGCVEPPILCKCCQKEYAPPRTSPAFYDIYAAPPKPFVLCWDNLADDGEAIEAADHELVHAYDDCKGINWDDCEQRACSEVRGVNADGGCRPGGVYNPKKPYLSYKDCVKKFAAQSTAGLKKCGNGTTAVKAVFERCFNDTSGYE